jgi:PilZ domain
MGILGLERRQKKRFNVDWLGTLTCVFPNREENIDVKVSEISATGARIQLAKLRVGPYHLVVGSESSQYTLNLNLPEGIVSTPARIVWYSMDEENRHFNVGVLFPQPTDGSRSEIEEILKGRK